VDAPGRLRVTVVALLATIVTAPAADASSRHPTRVEQTTLRLINKAREAKGLKPVRLDPRLWRAARRHTRDMLRRQYFAHGATSDRLSRYIHGGGVIGETLAWGSGTYASPASTVQSWLHSPPHRAILLDPDFRFVGIGSRGGKFAGQRWARVYTADFRG
jgi:uncharacterized protein YkwD